MKYLKLYEDYDDSGEYQIYINGQLVTFPSEKKAELFLKTKEFPTTSYEILKIKLNKLFSILGFSYSSNKGSDSVYSFDFNLNLNSGFKTESTENNILRLLLK